MEEIPKPPTELSAVDSHWLKIEGLSEKEAAKRLKDEGYNEIPGSQTRGRLDIVWAIAREPMIALLIAAATIYFILGELGEGLIMFGMVFVVIGITFYQENKTERALEALRDLSSPRALVIRDGVEKRIAGREVVRGDVVAINEGDRVPADATLLWCAGLSIDESLLTGESVSVRKTVWDGVLASDRPGGDDLPFVFSGTLVVKGRGIARAMAIGAATEMGKIGKALKSAGEERTKVQKEVDKFVRGFATFGLGLCLVLVVLYGATRGDWLGGFLVGIAVAMSMMPEEFPVVLTIYLALGAWRIAQKKVLTRHVPAVEMLGATTVLCVDKTGTLTMNKMSVSKLLAAHQVDDTGAGANPLLPEEFHEVMEYAVLASQKDPFDPMEKAFEELGGRYLKQTEHWHSEWQRVKEYPLADGFWATTHVWSPNGKKELIAAVKGAPETVAGLCHLNAQQKRELEEQVKSLAREGLRVLAVGRAAAVADRLPDKQAGFDFKFIGLVGLADPLRPTAKGSVKECRHAGIRLVMITGDYPETARRIACEIGLANCEDVVTGAELAVMTEKELRERLKTANIFARIIPEQKMLLVKALKANGEVVAMTGDGVNDAPALKAAHVGVAMGERGTDVAREAADLVLLDDDFTSLVRAVRGGRRVFDNMKKAMVFVVAAHLPIAALALLPVILNWPLVLLPVHIIFLELIIDPACSLVFEAEPEDPAIMDRPPRPMKEKLLSRRTVLFGVWQGLFATIMVLAVLLVTRWRGVSEEVGRSLTYTALVTAYLGLIVINVAWNKRLRHIFTSPNRIMWYILGGAMVFLVLTLEVPFLRQLFHFAPLHWPDVGLAFAAGLVSIVFFEIIKLVRGKKLIV